MQQTRSCTRGRKTMPSSHSGAFLDAILDNPEDDAPRLIYADWLDEQGDSARAEFIRLQCALARSPSNDRRRPGWREREEALLAEHGSVWLGSLGGLFYLHSFHRG